MTPLQAKSVYEFGGFRLDVANQLLLHSQRPVDLTGKELKILAVLVQHHDRIVKSEELVLNVWGPEGNRYIRNLSHHIARI
jgi:DNA-binding response OmpR family regulator